jgi:DNA-binding transcriptional LysR family regulator
MIDDLDGMTVFVAVAEARGFRAAGDRLGVSASAVSQAIRRLEQRIGVVLVQRTTRSVHLTEAGERLYAAARPALDELRTAVAAVGELADNPRGTLRLLVATAAETFLTGAVLEGFLAAYPEVRLDLDVSNEVVDIVARGYDAGVQLGEVIDQDMSAVAVSEELRLAVVGSPDYFTRRPVPVHPRDLAQHVCLNWRAVPGAPPYRWEFTDPADGREFTLAINARVTSTESPLNQRLARAGLGLAIVFASEVRDQVARGELVSVLQEFCPPFAGCYLYYPARRRASPPLRALLDYLQRHPWRPSSL